MYDRVKLVLYSNLLSEPYNCNEVLNRIDQIINYSKRKGSKGVWRGRVVTVKESKIIFKHSIPKCLYGHNLTTVSLKEVEQFIMMLSSDLGLPMNLSVVDELEFAHNFIVDNPPVAYLQKLSVPKNLKKGRWPETLYMNNKHVAIKFYDKMVEAKKKGELPKFNRENLPPNLLRYEVTFDRKELKKLFGREIMAQDLWSKEVFWTLVAEWFNYYEMIDKLPNNCWDVDFNSFKSAKDFDRWCVCIANEEQNLYNYIKNILFKFRENPQAGDRIIHQHIKERINAALKWQHTHILQSSLSDELNKRMEDYLTWLLEESEDGMTVEEQRELFGGI